MAGHAQLKFVMTECSETQIRLTRPSLYCASSSSHLTNCLCSSRKHVSHIKLELRSSSIFGDSCFFLDFRTSHVALFNGLMISDIRILVLHVYCKRSSESLAGEPHHGQTFLSSDAVLSLFRCEGIGYHLFLSILDLYKFRSYSMVRSICIYAI